MLQTTTPVRILLVEDNPADVHLAREGLRESGVPHTLYSASDGQEALDFLFQRGDCQTVPLPHLVLLDLNLPRKNGHDVLREIKACAELRHLPVIVFSSSLSERDVAKSYELRANCFVRKPGDLDEMFRVLKSIVTFWSQTTRPEDGAAPGHQLAAMV